MIRVARRADVDGFGPDSYQPWKPAAAYALGQTVVPRERNGHRYTVTVAGTSGALEPAWPLVDAATVGDGTVTWAEDGFAPWSPTWSIRAGAACGWRIKAGKAAGQYSFSAGTDRFDVNQLLEHCLTMARQYEAGVGTASTRLVGRQTVVYASVLGN